MILKFDSRAFSLLAVQKACHRFSHVASFEVAIDETSDGKAISVNVSPLVEKSADGLVHLEQRLRNEVLDQQLREQIRSQTEGVRNLILSHAFSKTGLIVNVEAPASL